MADFTSDFWNLYIAVISVVSVLGCGVFLFAQTKRRTTGDKVDTTGHVWDETLAEYNNPLPRWHKSDYFTIWTMSCLYMEPGLSRPKGTTNSVRP